MDNSELFKARMEKHDRIEASVMDIFRKHTDRKHLPDRRISFCNIPVSWDMKTTINVEKASHDEYFRLWSEGEYVFIVYQNVTEQLLANWITDLTWDGPKPPSQKSTCGDWYYTISGGIELMEFIKKLKNYKEYPYMEKW
jgi:hypothetical protein